jgi:hypothetical protein
VGPNQVTGHFGTVGGGWNNRAGDLDGDPATGLLATVGGGQTNAASGSGATVGGGAANAASGQSATVGGGQTNAASGSLATVGGGAANAASGFFSTVGGGQSNTASGDVSTVPGGGGNQAGGQYSLAAGVLAKVRNPTQSGDADGDEGTFAWADATFADFTSTGPNQFLIRASGGVGINTNAPRPGWLSLSGTGIVRARVNSDSNGGLTLALNDQNHWSVASVSPGHFLIYNDRIGQNALTISTTDNTVTAHAGLRADGMIVANVLGSAGGTTLCRNASNQISTCSSSQRYKAGIRGFGRGLELVDRLRPVSFRWRADDQADFGLVAEEVAEVEPLLVTRNGQGEVEGVKYDRVAVVLVNAIREQQAQIAALQEGRGKDTVEGVVTTDAGGVATIQIPEWFGARDRDVRYQLTVIGQFAQAIVARKLEGSRFTIQTDKPGVEVSWQVTGVRKEPVAETQRMAREDTTGPGPARAADARR